MEKTALMIKSLLITLRNQKKNTVDDILKDDGGYGIVDEVPHNHSETLKPDPAEDDVEDKEIHHDPLDHCNVFLNISFLNYFLF